MAAGVFIVIGQVEQRVWGVGSVFNAGQGYACGSGILKNIGGEGVNAQMSTIQVLAGGVAFCGSGDLMYVGVAFARAAITQAQYGFGMVW